MHSKKYEDYLLLYHYGELEGQLKVEFETHLKDCPECRANIALLKQTGKVLDASVCNPPEKLLDKVLDLTKQKPKFSVFTYVKNMVFNGFYKPAIAFTAAVLLVVAFNVYKKPNMPKDLWFGDLDNKIALLNTDIDDMKGYFASSDYLMTAKMSELEEMFDSMKSYT